MAGSPTVKEEEMAVEEDDGKEEEEGSDGVGDRGTRGDEDWEEISELDFD